MVDHLEDPQAISWEEMKDELGFTDAERRCIAAGAKELIAQARAYRPTEIMAERSSSVASATGSIAADGLTPTAEAVAIAERWVRGEISTAEMRSHVRQLHGIAEPVMPLNHPDDGSSA